MKKWNRNASRFIVGEDKLWYVVLAFYVVLFTPLIAYLEYNARYVENFAARYGSPSGTFWSLVDNFHLLYPRFFETAWRGYSSLVIAGLVAYPLGALLPCFRYTARIAEVSVNIFLSMPFITVIVVVQAIYGFSERAVYILALWATCGRLYGLAFEASKYLNTLQKNGKPFDEIADAVSMETTSSWVFYRKFIMPELRAHHLQSMRTVALGIWGALMFAEALSVDVIGLGEWIIKHSTGTGASINNAWAGSILLMVLVMSSRLAISQLARFLGVELSNPDTRR